MLANRKMDKKKLQRAKGKDKGKTKLAYAPNPKVSPPHKRENLAKDSVYHHCKEVVTRGGTIHPTMLSRRRQRMLAGLVLQGFKECRKLKHGTLSLYVGNGMCAIVKAIGSFDLVLPSGLIIVLDNYHFAPTITRGVVSISCLIDNGYIHTFTNYCIFVSKDNVFYFNAILRDGIYEIDMHNLYPNVSSICNVSNKRAKHALDATYLWHCRLGHINKKRIEKLQCDRNLQPTHDESLEKCKSCISEKMARKPFPHQVERAKELLGLIHTDVCGPFRTVSREGASYFITFTDDFNHYGYVYLMKDKHGVFETFKSFWGYALESAARILNMVPTKKVDRMPYEIWHGKALKLSYLRVWGCEALVKQDTSEKLDSRSIKYIFTGYPKEIGVTTSTIHSRIRFLLLEILSSLRIISYYKKRVGVTDYSKRVEPAEVEPHSVEVPIHRSKRIYQAPTEEHELRDLNEPPNYKDALSSHEYDKWLDVMNTEM
ncbi:retrotransposon protein, putative, ty1-copia subclass [Tanacetum coccineum]